MKPLLIMVAGPNGAGKSTFYESYLSHLDLPFLNADNLAREIRVDAYTATAEIASARDRLISLRRSFITETVLSDPVGEKIGVLVDAARQGFDVRLIYIGLDSPALSRERVADRVGADGHDVPEEKLAGRYHRSLENLRRAIRDLPLVQIYDNSDHQAPHRFIAEFRNGKLHRRCEGAVPPWAAEFTEPE